MFPNTEGFHKHSSIAKASNAVVSREQSRIMLQNKKLFILTGTPVCRMHQQQIVETVSEYMVARKGFCLKPTPPKSLAESPELNSAPVIGYQCRLQNQEDQFVVKTSPVPRQRTDLEKAVLALAKAANIQNVHISLGLFSDLTPQTQQKRFSAGGKMFDAVCHILGKEMSALFCQVAGLPLVKKA